ncbi:HNH endonuclease [Burkholderia glumae]|uniref:HNH endonuclease n=1 Tax=Burkholderia glumae TaxID=337 RepID=UPI00214FACEE|nr:HNH endonuclease [Burkholderia glumae]
MTTQEESINFYNTHYDIIGQWFLHPGEKVILGDMSNRVCRFCGKSASEETFKNVAHAIPELLGNKSIESAYECDTCNGEFGRGIENDLGNWSKPMRTLVRIRGKSGVPTLKKGGDKPGWRIEYDESKLNVTSYEQDPIFEVDEDKKTVTFKLRRDAYTPVAVLKAFMKIGLTLMPDEEIENFRGLMGWVREKDHSKPYLSRCPVVYAFQPGPMPNDLIAACILRRKTNVTGCHYAFLVLGYGNEVFQVPLPSEHHDGQLSGKSISMPPFPVPGHPDAARYGEPKRAVLDWMSHQVRRGEIATIQMGFESRIPVAPPEANLDEKSK